MKLKLMTLVTALAFALGMTGPPAHAQTFAPTLSAHSRLMPTAAIAVPAHSTIKAPKITVWYDLKAYDKHGHFKWERKAHNLLTTQGANAYMNSTIMGGIPVTAETEANSSGSPTATVAVLTQANTATTGQTSLIIPGSVTSLVFGGGFSGTFKDNNGSTHIGDGVITCTGTCTNFTSGTINYTTGTVTVNCS